MTFKEVWEKGEWGVLVKGEKNIFGKERVERSIYNGGQN